MESFVSEINEFQKRLFWFSNFPGAAILNNCDVSWLPYCFKTKVLCANTKEQPWEVTIIQDGGAQEIWNQNKRFWNSFISDTNDSIRKRLNNFDCKHYVKYFEVVFLF